MYTSTLFKYSLCYARSLKPDRIYILSAKHGLVSLDRTIDPYDRTLNAMSRSERKTWSDGILRELRKENDLESDQFVILGGNKYREFLVESIKRYSIPMERLRIGEQIQFLKEKINE
ncbi:MAG: hypothetical protein QXU18_16365 [Thermoplasmatales archaeon]